MKKYSAARTHRISASERERLVGMKPVLYLSLSGHLPVFDKEQATQKLGRGQLLRVRENSNTLSNLTNQERTNEEDGKEVGERRNGEGGEEER